MSKIYLFCGKICSGKTYYAKQLKEKYNAVILSTDEATFDLINNEQGEFYNVFAARVNNYLKKTEPTSPLILRKEISLLSGTISALTMKLGRETLPSVMPKSNRETAARTFMLMRDF